MKRSVLILQTRVDSVQQVLNVAMSSIESNFSQSSRLVSYVPRVSTAKKQMRVQILGTLFGELTKKLEINKFSLDREEPTIQIVDAPTFPLEKFDKGRVKLGIIWGFRKVLLFWDVCI